MIDCTKNEQQSYHTYNNADNVLAIAIVVAMYLTKSKNLSSEHDTMVPTDPVEHDPDGFSSKK